jgi:hypothetical protein
MLARCAEEVAHRFTHGGVIGETGQYRTPAIYIGDCVKAWNYRTSLELFDTRQQTGIIMEIIDTGWSRSPYEIWISCNITHHSKNRYKRRFYNDIKNHQQLTAVFKEIKTFIRSYNILVKREH